MAYDADAPATSKSKLIAQKARDLIEKGWTKSAYHIPGGVTLVPSIANAIAQPAYCEHDRFCMLGALNKAAGRNLFDIRDHIDPTLDPIARAMDIGVVHAHELPCFNDSCVTTKEQVLAAFDHAIANL